MGLRLFLPDEWVADPERCARAGVPSAEVRAHAKGEIALAELDRVRAAGARFGCVLADAGYGTSAAFRHGLDARGLSWAVGIARNQKVYPADMQMVAPSGTVSHSSVEGRSSAISSHHYGRRTYSGRPSSTIRFSTFTAIAISVTRRRSVRDRSPSPTTV